MNNALKKTLNKYSTQNVKFQLFYWISFIHSYKICAIIIKVE